MTDATIADTLNRRAAKLITAQMDTIELTAGFNTSGQVRWHWSAMADVLLSDAPDKDGLRAWLVGFHAARTPDLTFDGPADEDWENLFSYFRAEILARRDPQTPSVHAAETPVPDSVGSR